MKSGKVVSYSAEKKYGFIKSGDGESYFFHLNDVAMENKKDIRRGADVQFEDVPTPKGMAAKKVTAEQTFPIYVSPGSDIIVSKTNSCGRDNEAVFSLGRVEVEHKDPNEAVVILKQKARSVGCNAVLKLQRGSRTGSAWTNSNYKFTVHKFSAEIALVKQKSSTSDSVEAESNQAALKAEIADIKGKGKPSNRAVNDSGPFGIVVAVIVAVLFLMFVGGR